MQENYEEKESELYDYQEVDKSNCLQKEKIKKINNVISMIIFIFVILIIIILSLIKHYQDRQYKIDMISELTELTDDDKICFVAKVKNVTVGPKQVKNKNISGSNDTIYITDYDGHIFSIDFEPELLLLEDGSYIKIYYNIDYWNKIHIKIDRYEMYGFSIYEYYMNKYDGGN